MDTDPNFYSECFILYYACVVISFALFLFFVLFFFFFFHMVSIHCLEVYPNICRLVD